MTFDFLLAEDEPEADRLADQPIDRAARWYLVAILVVIAATVSLSAFS